MIIFLIIQLKLIVHSVESCVRHYQCLAPTDHSVPAIWTNFFASTAGWMNKQDLRLVVRGIHSSCNFDFSEWVLNLEFVQNCVMCYFCNVCCLFFGNFDSYPQGYWKNILQLKLRLIRLIFLIVRLIAIKNVNRCRAPNSTLQHSECTKCTLSIHLH